MQNSYEFPGLARIVGIYTTTDLIGKRTYERDTTPVETYDCHLLKCEYGPSNGPIYDPLFELVIPGLKSGDVVWINGQAQATNDLNRKLKDTASGAYFCDCSPLSNGNINVRFALTLNANGNGIAASSTNVILAARSASLHLSAVFPITSNGETTLQLIGCAKVADVVECTKFPHLSIQASSGGLQALVFRPIIA